MTYHTWRFTLKALKNGREWELQGDYLVSFLGARVAYVVIKKGFVYDGASIPRFAWRLIGAPMTGKYTRAALVHDWLYVTKQVHVWGSSRYPMAIGRKYADKIMLTFMKRDGVVWWRRNAIYLAIRVRGQHAWET